jgi:soluble P-type ATPase
MKEVIIPGFKQLRLSHLVLDYNGTLACDGRPLDGIKERLELLAQSLEIHILTADTFGSVRDQLAPFPGNVMVIPRDEEAQAKANYVRRLGGEQTAAIGNGRNDRLMLKEAALGIAVVQQEGTAVAALVAADVVIPDILAALDLLLKPDRLRATLRS